MRNWLHTVFNRVVAYGLSLVHPYTIGRTVMAIFTGINLVMVKALAYAAGDNKSELRQANPVKHHQETSFRRWVLLSAVVSDVLILAITVHYLDKKPGLTVWILVHIIIVFLVGRNGPVMNNVQTPWLVGEALVKRVVDSITGTPETRKLDEHTQIVSPVARLASRKGFETTVRVAEHGRPDKLETGAKALAQKMRKGTSTVFVYTIKQDASAFRLLFLDTDPWDAPPSDNPLVIAPRPVNLWREDIDMGVMPDSTPFYHRIVEAGDGGGKVVGGAPRAGKTNLLNNLLVPIVLHSGSRLHLIDGKAVDFEPLRHVAETFLADANLTNKQLLVESIKILDMLTAKVNLRRKLLLPLEQAHVTEDLCAKHGITLDWLVIDEMAVITEDIVSTDPKGVKLFTEKLQWLVRMGPAFGVYVVLATQRPSDVSIPAAIRNLIIFRAALYISEFSGSQAILGKAGPSFRADWLDPTQKGVALITQGVGQVRLHKVTLSDLRTVATFVLSQRGDPDAPALTVAGRDWPEPVRTMLAIMDDEMAPKEMPTWKFLAELAERGQDHSATTLGAALAAYGVTSANVGPKREKGYRRADLQQVPRSALTDAQAPLDGARRADPSGTRAADPSGTDEPREPGSPMAANYEPDDWS